jgi:hypothetical protein
MLIPINCAGVLRSVEQIITGHKAAFGRTPKVENRISISALHIVFQFGLIATISAGAASHLLQRQYSVGLLCALNAAVLLYGSAVLIGWDHACKDLFYRPNLRTSDRSGCISLRSSSNYGILRRGTPINSDNGG